MGAVLLRVEDMRLGKIGEPQVLFFGSRQSLLPNRFVFAIPNCSGTGYQRHDLQGLIAGYLGCLTPSQAVKYDPHETASHSELFQSPSNPSLESG